MPNRANDWLTQADLDLEMAEQAARMERHEWACFVAQQAAEKAVKALHLWCGQDAWGHVVARLLKELPTDVPDDLVQKAKVLDGYYIPTRYPNGHPAGAPAEHYGPLHSGPAVDYAREIVAFARAQMATA